VLVYKLEIVYPGLIDKIYDKIDLFPHRFGDKLFIVKRIHRKSEETFAEVFVTSIE